jgi:RNA polymerase sigma-70 factor (ECF subfamily)
MAGAASGGASQDADRRRMAWMAAAQAGDRAAYAALLRDCVPVVEAVARRQGVPPSRVDDVVQDMLLTVHRVRHTYDPARPFTAWLRAIAQRRAVDLLRRQGRQGARELHAPLAYEGHPDPAENPERSLEQGRRADTLRAAIAALPAGQREAVEQLGLQERTLAEAAGATGRTTGALKVKLHRALKALRASLGARNDQ